MPENANSREATEKAGPKPARARSLVLLAVGVFLATLVVGTVAILALQSLAGRDRPVAHWEEPEASGEATSAGEKSDPAKAEASREAPVAPPTREQALWAWATCAILTESNGADHERIGGCEPGTTEAARVAAGLEEWWGVTDRQTLLETLAWLEGGGHRVSFEAMGSEVSAASPEQLAEIRTSFQSDPEIANQIEVALEHYVELGDKSILGWDYSRYVMLCGWGYVTGYLTEEEALERMMPAARLLQQTFDSWEDLGENYLIGREFWSLSQTAESGAELRRTHEHLLSDPDSPWREIPWDLDLKSPEAQ